MSIKESESRGTADAPGGRTRAALAAFRSATAAVGSKVEAVKDDTADTVARSGAKAKDVLESVGNSAKESMQKSGRLAQDAAGAAAQTMHGLHAAVVSPAIGKAQSAIVETKGRLASAAELATQRVDEARESASERLVSVGESLRQRIKLDVAGPARARLGKENQAVSRLPCKIGVIFRSRGSPVSAFLVRAPSMVIRLALRHCHQRVCRFV